MRDEGLYYPEDEAGYRLSQLASDVAIDRMIADAQVAGISLLEGPDGLLNQITRQVLERALGAEMDDHLGYVRGDPAGSGTGNSRNGFYGKTVTTTAGPVRIQVPRDRNSEFEPVIVPKGARRLGQVDDMILSLYSRGMTTRDIQAHLAEVYGADVSPALISKVTDVVAEEITAWQTRPLDSFYAILYIDALMVKVRDGGTVDNKAAYLVTGVDIDGFKHVLGIWMAASEGARFWAGVLAELRNRGIKDVLFVCCDGLGGLPEAIEATWPKATVQTCVIHLIRASMRYVSWKDRKKAAAAMRPVYTAVNEAAARAALDDLRRDFGKKSPAWSQPGNGPGTSSSRSCSSTPPSARSSTRPTPSSPSTSSCARSSRTAATSPTTTPRSSCSTSGSATSPDGTSTATAASANEENAVPAATAGKQPSTPSPSTSATASPSNPRNPLPTVKVRKDNNCLNLHRRLDRLPHHHPRRVAVQQPPRVGPGGRAVTGGRAQPVHGPAA